MKRYTAYREYIIKFYAEAAATTCWACMCICECSTSPLIVNNVKVFLLLFSIIIS